MVPTSKVPKIHFIKFTKCFTPHPRWQEYRTTWPTKDVTEDSSHHMDLTSEGWEAAITSMKHHWWRTQGSHIATGRKLSIIAAIQDCLTSRSLCALSSNPINPTYLFPGHFLIGKPLTQLPSADYTNVKCKSLSRWQTYPQQLQQFWQMWSSDHLQSLKQHQRWYRTSCDLELEEVDLLWEDNTPPLQWPTAIITETHPGNDGVVHVVTLKTS